MPRNGGGTMPRKEQYNTVQIGNTVFYVTSKFAGAVELQYLIKRLIQKEMEQRYC